MPNSKSSHESINKIETGYCSRSRWGDRWVNWEGALQYRGKRDHVNPEATVEAVPAFLQKRRARQHLLPLQGWWAMPNSPEWAFVSIQSQTDGSSTLAQRSSGPLSAKQRVSCLFMTRGTNKEDCMYPHSLGPIKLRKSEGKKGSCRMTGRKTPMPAYLWWWCSVTSQLRILGTEILSSLQ